MVWLVRMVGASRNARNQRLQRDFGVQRLVGVVRLER